MSARPRTWAAPRPEEGGAPARLARGSHRKPLSGTSCVSDRSAHTWLVGLVPHLSQRDTSAPTAPGCQKSSLPCASPGTPADGSGKLIWRLLGTEARSGHRRVWTGSDVGAPAWEGTLAVKLRGRSGDADLHCSSSALETAPRRPQGHSAFRGRLGSPDPNPGQQVKTKNAVSHPRQPQGRGAHLT